jgi:hypothetical protein
MKDHFRANNNLQRSAVALRPRIRFLPATITSRIFPSLAIGKYVDSNNAAMQKTGPSRHHVTCDAATVTLLEPSAHGTYQYNCKMELSLCLWLEGV